ncbi:MAG TPA: DnaJ domain-containing protein [Ramlibacter sp.]|nr:DnaJ domain-containing protein [Ramlibacter sp.]
MHLDDPYHELGLAPDCSDAEVKAAWRRAAAQWHPDRNASPQALRKIQRINRALEEIRRARGEPGADADEQAPPGPKPDVEQAISLTIEEVVTGCSREVRGEVVEDCADCEGSGLQSQPTACGECGGAGHIRKHLWFGWVPSTSECSACQGHGQTRQGCAACAASGKAPASKYRCQVKVAAGARAGDVLDVSARVQGRQHKHKLALRLRVQLQPHEFFTYDADGTVKCELPVDGFAWTANRWTEVPTPRGLQQMKLQRGFLSYRIKGAGLPWGSGGEPADCIVTVVPLFPQELSREQEAAIDRLVKTNTGAADSAAGERMALWERAVEGWQGRCAGKG